MPPSTKTWNCPASARFPIGRFWAPLLIALAGFAAYANSFSGPYVFDDLGSIPENPTIRQLWPIGRVLTPPPGQTVSGRPLVNLSLAINYAFGGTGVAGYHLGNLLIHLLAGLTLFGIVRRTLVPKTRMATQLACAVALLWTLHPLQTESVTYLIQRAESLMGLFYLLTLYCFIRWIDADVGAKRARVPLQSGSGSRQAFVESGRSNGWAWLSGLCCLLGMASKEVMVSAPGHRPALRSHLRRGHLSGRVAPAAILLSRIGRHLDSPRLSGDRPGRRAQRVGRHRRGCFLVGLCLDSIRSDCSLSPTHGLAPSPGF